MRSARPKLFLLVLLLGGVLMATRAFAADDKLWVDQVKNDLGDIKTRLTAIEERQKEIIAKEDNILEELDRIRIWVHRK